MIYSINAVNMLIDHKQKVLAWSWESAFFIGGNGKIMLI